jgi:hypothetical protein
VGVAFELSDSRKCDNIARSRVATLLGVAVGTWVAIWVAVGTGVAGVLGSTAGTVAAAGFRPPGGTCAAKVPMGRLRAASTRIRINNRAIKGIKFLYVRIMDLHILNVIKECFLKAVACSDSLKIAKISRLRGLIESNFQPCFKG